MRPRKQKNSRFTAYLLNHLQVLFASLGRLYRQPVAALMTIAVIAIALTLPTGFSLLISNFSKLTGQWDGSAQISVYLNPQVSLKQAQALVRNLKQNKDVQQITLIDKQTGLEEFKKVSGFEDALSYLDTNPLPIVLVIQPVIYPGQPYKTARLVKQMEKEKLVELAQLDVQWVKRLLTLLEIADRGVWVTGIMLALAVLLVVGNTIRLDIQNRRVEIEVAKLIGASDAFIRRPFLYTGFWYGLLGGILAWILTTSSILMMDEPVHRLARLYQSDFRLDIPGIIAVFTLISISCVLGLAGSWLAVSRHLKDIEPA